MALTVTNSFEGGSDGVAVSSANSGGASGTAFASVIKNAGATITYSSAYPAQGSGMGIQFSYAASNAGYAVMNFASTVGARVSFRLWAYVPSSSLSSSPRFLEFRDSSSVMLVALNVRSTDGLLAFGQGTQFALSASPFPLDQLVFVEGALTTSATAGTTRCEITAYAANNLNTPLWSNTNTSVTAGSTNALNTVRLGTSGSSTSAYVVYYDDFGITDTLSTNGTFMGPVNPPPTASFTTSTTTGLSPLSVTFTDTSTLSPSSWAWDFNDGTTSTSQNPTHVYSSPGIYTPTLIATNTYGSSLAATATITATPSTFVNTFEGGPLGTLIMGTTPGPVNSGGISGSPFDTTARNTPNTINYSTAQVWRGAQSAEFAYNSLKAGYLAWSITVPTATSRVTAKTYIYFGGVTSGAIGDQVILFYSSSTALGSVYVDSAGHFAGVGGTSYTPPTNTWLRVEAAIQPGTTTSNGTFEWAVYTGESLTPNASGSTNTANMGTSAITQVRFGTTSSSLGTRTNYFDMMSASTTLSSGFIGVEIQPVASFTGTPTSGTLPLVVTFTDTSTNTPTVWYWDFGDGSTSTSKNPVHTYTVMGNYTVSLTAINSGGSTTSTLVGYVTAIGSSTIYNTFEGGTLGANITVGNSGGASGTAFGAVIFNSPATVTYDNAYPAQASLMGMKITYGASLAAYAATPFVTTAGSRTTFRIWTYLASAALASNQPRLMEFRDTVGTVLGIIYFSTGSAGKVYIGNDVGTSGVLSPVAFPTDQLVFMQGALTTSATGGNGLWELSVYNANDLSTPLWTITKPSALMATTNPLATFRIGSTSTSASANTYSVWYDDFLATDTLLTGYPGPRIPQITLPYIENWSGTNGASWPGNWVPGTSNGSGGSATIQSNAGRLTVGTTSSSWMKSYLTAIPSITDTDLSISFTIGSQVVSNFNFQINADATQYSGNPGEMPNNGYTLNFTTDTSPVAGNYDMWRMSGGSYTQIISTTTITLTAGTKYRIRFQRIGGLIRFRIWQAASSEPTTWTASYTDATPLPLGRIAVTDGNAVGQYIDFDDLVVSIPTLGSMKSYNGTSFVAKPVKIWTGSAWTIKRAKQWNGTSWALTTGNPVTVFTDTFTRADGTVGNGWVINNGTWAIASNQLSITSSSTSARISQVDTIPGGENQFAQVTVVNPASNTTAQFGVLCRLAPDASTFYAFIRATANVVSLVKYNSPTFTTIGSRTITIAAGAVMRIEVSGTNIRGSINGTIVVSVTDATISGSSISQTGIRTFTDSTGILLDNYSCGIL